MSEVPDFDKMDIYDMLNFMGAEGRDALIKQMNKKMNSMQDSIIEQAASTYIKDAYTHVGIDTDQIETSYILHTGAKNAGTCIPWNGGKYYGRTISISCRSRCRTRTS